MDRSIPPAAYISTIEVQNLFGEVNVSISRNALADPRLLIVYGPNGSGKTTLLELITSLISPDENAGHRTRLSKIPFSRAIVSFDGGVSIEAKKKDGLIGNYDWVIKKPGAESLYMLMKSVHGRILASQWDIEQMRRHGEMIHELTSIVKNVELLDDKRTFYVAEEDQPSIVERRLADGRFIQMLETVEDHASDPVFKGLAEVVGAVRREALLLSNRGNQGAQSIYTSLVNRIIETPLGSTTGSKSINSLGDELLLLQARSEKLARYGLVTAVDHGPLLDSLRNIGGATESIVANILSPYVESLSARLDAIQSLHDSLDNWIESLNRFLSPKEVHFRVGEQIQIISRAKRPLPTKDLSSGERHLLLLLTKAFLLRATGGILLVDEPELSLNTSWQRDLIHALLDSFGGSGCQLVVASHSLEIASRYEANMTQIGS